MSVETSTFYDNGDLTIPKENGRNPDPDGDNSNMEPAFSPDEVQEESEMSFII